MAVRYDKLKELLLADKERLETEIKGEVTTSGASVGYGNHMADDAAYAYEQTKSLSLEQNTKGLLIQVNEALHRFSDGTYGVCTDCGQSIDPARLEAIPYTSRCIRCAQK